MMAPAQGLPPEPGFLVDDGAELRPLEEVRCDLVIASDAMVIISHFGGIEPWKAVKTQQRFGPYVRPASRGTGGKRA
jgi:hypothetical protein